MTISATIPIEHMADANTELIELGHGPCFSVPLREGEDAATHAGFHAWDDSTLQASVEALDYPGLVVRYDAGLTVNFQPHVTDQALGWSDPTNWFDNPVMTGDRRTRNDKLWESLIDYNVWAPGTSGWREIVEDGYPAWIQPTGAHDAYAIGERVTHNGQDWEVTQGDGSGLNSWEPGVFGWTQL